MSNQIIEEIIGALEAHGALKALEDDGHRAAGLLQAVLSIGDDYDCDWPETDDIQKIVASYGVCPSCNERCDDFFDWMCEECSTAGDEWAHYDGDEG